MEIQTQMTEKDFIDVSFVMLYRKSYAKIMTAIGVLTLLFAFLSFSNPAFGGGTSQWIMAFVFLIAMPAFTYFNAKRNYASNKRFSEPISYTISQQFLEYKGESFDGKQTWDKIYKVTKTNNWILIWQNRLIANAIPRRYVSHDVFGLLKSILKEHSVKNNF